MRPPHSTNMGMRKDGIRLNPDLPAIARVRRDSKNQA
jgi:hypothetical protein